ncbi:MAG: PQQ-binding-like beta-propeller repeat protein, partial [Planctomycetaceae bacterium]
LQKAWGKDTLWWDLGTSPVLSANRVLIAVMQTGGSYVAAFDKATGKPVWKRDRDLEAPLEAAQRYTTPIVLKRDNRETLLVLGADHVTAHDVTTGKETWRVGGLNPTGQKYFRSISSPVLAGDLLLAPYSRGGTLTAIRLGGSGDVTKSHIAWENKGGAAADVPTPIVSGNRVFVCSDRGKLTCLDAKTGKTLWSGVTEKNRTGYSSSPILAGGRIYLTREDGKTFVMESGSSFKVVAANELDEFTVATPIFSQGQILLRTTQHLYCIGKRTTAPAAGK